MFYFEHINGSQLVNKLQCGCGNMNMNEVVIKPTVLLDMNFLKLDVGPIAPVP